MIAEEWSELNYPFLPEQVNEKSTKNVWWKCKVCGNEWKAVINARVKGVSCPVCAERKVLKGYNDLASTNAVLCKEWDYEKNKVESQRRFQETRIIVRDGCVDTDTVGT